MKSKFFLIFTFLFFFLHAETVFAADQTWVIGACEFDVANSQDSVSASAAKMFPVRILEKIGSNLTHVVYPDEEFSEKKYNLQKERLSLYLQLSSEYKKRDSLFLQNYSDFALKTKIAESEKSIKSIENKIDENLKELDEAEKEKLASEKNVENGSYYSYIQNDSGKFSNILKNLFTSENSSVPIRNISFYSNDISSLFTYKTDVKKEGYDSYNFENEVMNAGIRTLITGKITFYSEYVCVQVDAYSYPGGKLVASVTDVGSLKESDLISSNIANELVSGISNSMPVSVHISLLPENIDKNKVTFYLDEVRQTIPDESIEMESGVHSFLFEIDGYKNVSTSYYFEGNKNYNIQVTMEDIQEGFTYLEYKKPVLGNFYANGEQTSLIDNKYSRISINGDDILGQFITENGESAMIYIPENMAKTDAILSIKPNAFDKNKYIDTRRKLMYGSYSLLITSLLSTFYTYGNLVNEADLYKKGFIDYETAKGWENAYNISVGVSIGCGVLLAYTLFRYLLAADSVLPQKPKKTNRIYTAPLENEEEASGSGENGVEK